MMIEAAARLFGSISLIKWLSSYLKYPIRNSACAGAAAGNSKERFSGVDQIFLQEGISNYSIGYTSMELHLFGSLMVILLKTTSELLRPVVDSI